jgi:hypothetical protein
MQGPTNPKFNNVSGIVLFHIYMKLNIFRAKNRLLPLLCFYIQKEYVFFSKSQHYLVILFIYLFQADDMCRPLF